MKKVTYSLLTIISVLFFACSGSDGADGLDGVDGVDGMDGADGADAAPIEIFEIGTDLFFNPAANWYATPFQTFVNDDPIENDDVVLVYRLEFITSDDLDVWRQLPRPYFTDQGMLFYNFDFTTDGFLIYLEANFDFSTWEESDFLLRDQIFRIVVIPSELLELTSTTDLSDLGTLMKSLRLNERDIRQIQ